MELRLGNCKTEFAHASVHELFWRLALTESQSHHWKQYFKSVWSNYRPAVCMWPATAFSVARGSIQQKSSNLKFLKSVWVYICLTELLALDKENLHKNNTFLCTILFYLFILTSN